MLELTLPTFQIVVSEFTNVNVLASHIGIWKCKTHFNFSGYDKRKVQHWCYFANVRSLQQLSFQEMYHKYS